MSDLDSMTNDEVADELMKFDMELSKKRNLHAYEDAVMLQAIKRLRKMCNEAEVEELKRIMEDRYYRRIMTHDQQLHNFAEFPAQLSIYKKLGLFGKWFTCHEYVGEMGDGQKGYCKKHSKYITNPHSEQAQELFEKIAKDNGISDGDWASQEGEKILSNYFRAHFMDIIKPVFRCEEHIGKLKEIAVKI